MQARLKLFFCNRTCGILVSPASGKLRAAAAGQDHPRFRPDDSLLGRRLGPVLVLVHGLGSSKDGDWAG